MARRRRPSGRNISGILLLDKPVGITSNAALQTVKHCYRARKAGHTGSLDPLASGLLPICLGEATKLSAFLLDADKRYWVRVRLGEKTTTADAEGEIIESRPIDGIDEQAIRNVLPDFRGEIQQLPPMYSAVKHKGERLYDIARRGEEVEREPRTIHIHELELVGCELPEFELEVACTKGTYVRTLAEDIGERLGCGAHVVGLRRTGVGPYGEADLHALDEIERQAEERDHFAGLDAKLLPLDSALGGWPEIRLNKDMAFYIRQGQPVLVPKAPLEGWVRLYSGQEFLGVGEVLDDGRIAPRRLLAQASPHS